jgi:glycosyltransferase involved in cell wall biosynthesis
MASAVFLSAVVPFCNERENLEPLVAELDRELELIGRPYEILLVDDGSADGSREVADALTGSRPRLRVLHLERNSGQSAALVAGFAAAAGEYIVTLDADLQNDPADIVRMLEWIPQYGMVAGIRSLRRDRWLRRASSRIANGVRSRVLGDGIVDTGCSLKVFRRDLTAGMPRFQGMHRFLPLLVQIQGASVKQIPVGHRERIRSDSKYNIKNRLFRGIVDLAGVFWFKRRFARPRVAYETSVRTREPRASYRQDA